MPEQTVIERCRKIVVEMMNVPETDITHDRRFIEDLNADSLDVIELVMEAEDEFEISITDEEAERATTFGQAVAMIAGKVAGNE